MITYDVLRHACTPRIKGIYANWEADTFYRNMDAEGVAQALRLHNQYKKDGEQLRLGLYSPAPRCMYTLAIATAGQDVPMVAMSELFTPKGRDGDILNPAFEKYGNDLDAYVSDPTLYQTLKRFGNTAAEAIKREVASRGIENGVVVVANHAVTGNFIAYALANHTMRSTFLYTNMGYADRFRVEGYNVQYIPLK